MALTHKSINIREEVWRQLRINSELTGVPVRDFLTYLIVKSQPVGEDDRSARLQLEAIAQANEKARITTTDFLTARNPEPQPVAS